VKRSPFNACCDRCWWVLPPSLKGPLIQLSAYSEAGKEAKQAAVRFLQERKQESSKG
jgi:hypothetical protein